MAEKEKETKIRSKKIGNSYPNGILIHTAINHLLVPMKIQSLLSETKEQHPT